MNEEQKPIMTQAELEARVQQFRQELRDAAAAEEATKQTVGEVTPTPGPVPQPKPEQRPQPAPAPKAGTVKKEEPAAPPATKAKSKPETKPKKKHTGLKVLLVIILLLALLGFLLTQVFFGIAKADDAGMEETVGKGTYVLFSRLEKTPELDDIVVIRDEEGSKRIRYVAALKGDIVDYDRYDERLFIDDQPVAINYSVSQNAKVKFPHTIGGSEVFVLCVNRNAAENEGLFPKKSILGKVILTF